MQLYFLYGLIMNKFISKTFGGLSSSYYFRQLMFGSLLLIPFLYAAIQEDQLPYGAILFFIIKQKFQL